LIAPEDPADGFGPTPNRAAALPIPRQAPAMIKVLPLSSAILPPNFNLCRRNPVICKIIIRGRLARGGLKKAHREKYGTERQNTDTICQKFRRTLLTTKHFFR
jgi:hypothetical protein